MANIMSNRKTYGIVAAIVAASMWVFMVNTVHQKGMALCLPLTAKSGALGVITCVDSYSVRSGVCEPMSADDAPLGLIACKLDDEPQQRHVIP